MSTRALRLYNSTEQALLVGADTRLAAYAPTAGDGATVSERALIVSSASAEATLLDTLHRIERLLRQAERYIQAGTGDPVYLGLATDPASGVEYRSLVHDGSVRVKPTALVSELAARRLALEVMWKRADWFEGPESEIPLTNSTGTGVLGGLAVWNPTPAITSAGLHFQALANRIDDANSKLACFCTGDSIRISGSLANNGACTVADGGHAGYLITAEALVEEDPGMLVTICGGLNNHVEIAAADLAGALPFPLRLELTSETLDRGGSAYVGIGGWHDVAQMPPRVSLATGAGTLDDDTCIDGRYWHATWNDTAEARLKSTALTTALFRAAAGEQFLALLRLRAKTAMTDLWLKLQIELNASGPVLWSGPWVQATTATFLQELGTLRLPPFLAGPEDIDSAELCLYAKSYSAGAHALDLDGIFLLPVECFRHYIPVDSASLAEDESLTDDSISGYLYTTFSGCKRQTYVAYGSPLGLWPGRKQRIYIVADSQAGTADITRTLRVRAFYRERRRTL